MKWAALGAVFLLTTCPSSSSLTPEQMVEDLKQLEAVVLKRWPYLEDKKETQQVDVQALIQKGIDATPSIKDSTEWSLLLRQVVAGLKDGHSHIQLAVEQKELALPIEVIECEEGLVLQSVGDAAKAKGIEKGDRLSKINGRDVQAILHEVERYVSASTPTARRSLAIHHIPYYASTSKQPTVVEVEKQDGTKVECKLEPQEPSANLPGEIVSWKLFEKNIGFLKISSFNPGPAFWKAPHPSPEREKILNPILLKIKEGFSALAACDRLILDLRDNSGGSDALGTLVAQHLIPGDFPYLQVQHQVPSGKWGGKGTWTIAPGKEIQQFKGPVVVLINEGSFSVTDNLCACLKDQRPNTMFLGKPTHGGTGAVEEVAVLKHSQARLYLTTVRVWGPKGTMIEGRGTLPDKVVLPKRSDILLNRDSVLEAALAEARRRP